MVAGGMDQNVEHFIVYLLSQERGHLSLVMLTEAGPTEMIVLYAIIQFRNSKHLFGFGFTLDNCNEKWQLM